jgi:hypothetical protein
MNQQPRPEKSKHVVVKIKDYVISVKPTVVKMGEDPYQGIVWEIVTDGWTFPTFEDGIEVKGDHGEFSNGRLDETGTIYTLHNKNSHTHYYPYTIKVTNGKVTLHLDPGIGNGGNN